MGVERLLEDLATGTSLAKSDALNVLATHPPTDDQQVIHAIITLLTNISSEVRVAAVNALAHVTKKGARDIIDRLIARLKDSEDKVRVAAVDALAILTEQGDVRTIAAISDVDANVRL